MPAYQHSQEQIKRASVFTLEAEEMGGVCYNIKSRCPIALKELAAKWGKVPAQKANLMVATAVIKETQPKVLALYEAHLTFGKKFLFPLIHGSIPSPVFDTAADKLMALHRAAKAATAKCASVLKTAGITPHVSTSAFVVRDQSNDYGIKCLKLEAAYRRLG